MFPRLVVSAVSGLFALSLLSLASGCQRKGSREWRADDHDQEPGGGSAPANGAGNPTSAEDQLATLVEATWTNNCAVCHGRGGQGDGPQGPMVKAPNLTDPTLVDKLSDDQIVATIKNGRNKMPSFPNIPEHVARGLVMRIRALRAQ